MSREETEKAQNPPYVSRRPADDAVPAGATSRSRREASKCQSSAVFSSSLSHTGASERTRFRFLRRRKQIFVYFPSGRYVCCRKWKREDLLHVRRFLRVHPTSSGCLNQTLAGVGSLIISFERFPKFSLHLNVTECNRFSFTLLLANSIVIHFLFKIRASTYGCPQES